MRARGQRPEGALVLVGDSVCAAWAARNGFFFVPVWELGEDLASFAALHVIVRMASPNDHREKLERLALNARLVVVYDTQRRTQELLAA